MIRLVFILFFILHSCQSFHTNLYQEISYEDHDTKHIEAFFLQPYSYLGEGSQMFAFVSEDGKCVLKLFKARHKKPFKLSRFFHDRMRSTNEWKASQNRWKTKFFDTCRRYIMAFTHLKEETGLLFTHFKKTKKPLFVTLIHKKKFGIKIKTEIDLSRYPFILQKKAILISEYLRKNPEKHLDAKQALKNLFIQRIEKGFSDPRQTLSTNYGLIEDQAIQLDVGKIEPFQGDKTIELEKIFAHIEKWISNYTIYQK